MPSAKGLSTKKIAYIAVMTALTALITCFPHITLPTGGYIHLGDAVIIAACAVLGYYGLIAGALGAAIADLVLYPIYAPATLVAKAVFALAGVAISAKIRGQTGKAIGFFVGGILMQAVYFAFDAWVLGMPAAGLTALWLLLQTVVSVPLGLAAAFFLKRLKVDLA